MKLPEKAVKEFRILWLESFGEEIDLETAERHATKFLMVMQCAFLR